MMCIFQVHLISTNSNPPGEGATLRQNRDGQRVEVSRPPPVENYHHFMGGACGPQQSVEGQDSSGKTSKEVVEIHLLLCNQSLHYQCLHRVQGVLCEAKEEKVHSPRFQSGCCKRADWSIFKEEKALLCSAARPEASTRTSRWS